MVKKITFNTGNFDEEYSLLLMSIFQLSGSQKELVVLQGHLSFPENTHVLGTLVESSSRLSVLDMSKHGNDIHAFEAIIKGLKAKTSKLEAVLFPSLNPDLCEHLLESLPAY